MKYKAKLWKIFSLYIRLRDSDVNGYCRCISCEAVKHFKDCDAGHFVPKNKGNAIYFDENDVNSQCQYCNRYLHGNLYLYGKALEDKIGKKAVNELFRKSKSIKKYSDKEYLDLIDYYENEVKKLKQRKNVE